MLDQNIERSRAALLSGLYPLAEQAARILEYFGGYPNAISMPDGELAARITLVSAEHVAIVRRVLVETGLAQRTGFAVTLVAPDGMLRRLATNLEGIATYLRFHKDQDAVHLVITEPGENSALRKEIDKQSALSPKVFQTVDAFMNLARGAKRELIVLAPFIDDYGAEFLLRLFTLCSDKVRRCLICRPLSEEHCGRAFLKRSNEFRELEVNVFEYALPSLLPSRRETFHAKVVLADDSAFYVGSSNMMSSALERSLECGVVVQGESARQLYAVLSALKSIARPVDPFASLA
jgi:PLD-like domain